MDAGTKRSADLPGRGNASEFGASGRVECEDRSPSLVALTRRGRAELRKGRTAKLLGRSCHAPPRRGGPTFANELNDAFMNKLSLIATVLLLGCSSAETEGPPAESSYAASGGTPEERLTSASPVPPLPEEPRSYSENDVIVQPRPELQPEPRPVMPTPQAPVIAAPQPLPVVQEVPASDGKFDRPLRGDLSPEKLVEFLAGADRDMQTIVSGKSGIADPTEARETLLLIVRKKLEAARRLADMADATPKQRSEGARGELQSLSHLASLGDLKAAEELETLAKKSVSSDDERLASDSRLVLIGFAIEQLQNGKPDSPAAIVSQVEKLASGSAADDVPAMMVMGQAREILAKYGHEAEAKTIRDTIIDLFADSPDAAIAQMAAQVAGNVRFDTIDTLREQAIDGKPVTAAAWREAVETLVDESPDLQTVQYLAGAALEFEAMNLTSLVDATYDVMASRFDDPATSTGVEAELAMRAKEAREGVIGRVFDPALPSVDGSPLSLLDYRGKVVLMPFWASTFPQSLQIVGRLIELEKKYSQDVAIVGMNLDAAGPGVDKDLRDNDLGFPSYRAESSVNERTANPVAAQFGLVSMPFIVILDPDGRVAQIDFTGRNLETTVTELIESSLRKPAAN